MVVRYPTRITRPKQEEIYERYTQGDTLSNLSRCFGVSSARIKQVIVDVSRAKARPSLSDKLKRAYPNVRPTVISGAVNSIMRSGFYKSDALPYISFKDFFTILATIKEEDMQHVRNVGMKKAAFLKRAMTDYQRGALRDRC